jgi:hypothetical protein
MAVKQRRQLTDEESPSVASVIASTPARPSNGYAAPRVGGRG